MISDNSAAACTNSGSWEAAAKAAGALSEIIDREVLSLVTKTPYSP